MMPNCHNGVHSPAGSAPPMQEPTYCQMNWNLPMTPAVAIQRIAAGRTVCAACALRYSFYLTLAAVYTTGAPSPPQLVVG